VERRGPSVGNVGEWCVESWHLQGCSSRLCRLSIVGLAPMSKYWTYRSHAGDMGPVSLVVYHWQILDFAPTASKLAQERNWVRTYGSVSRRAVDYVESPFSRVQWPGSTLSMTHERLLSTGTTRRKHMPDIRGLAWKAYVSCWSDFPLQGVHQFELPRLSDMSKRLFVTVFT
jgi:hypothetical protein